MIKCKHCKQIKDESEFYASRLKVNKHFCITCSKESSRKYYIKNKEKINKKNNIYYRKNAEILVAKKLEKYRSDDEFRQHCIESQRNYRKNNKDKINSYNYIYNGKYYETRMINYINERIEQLGYIGYLERLYRYNMKYSGDEKVIICDNIIKNKYPVGTRYKINWSLYKKLYFDDYDIVKIQSIANGKLSWEKIFKHDRIEYYEPIKNQLRLLIIYDRQGNIIKDMRDRKYEKYGF